MKRFLGLLLGLVLCSMAALSAQTTQPVIVKNGMLNGAGQTVTVNGIGPQSTCSVTTTGTWSGTLSFYVQDPQQLTLTAIKGYAPDGSGTGGTTTTSNISGWTFPCAAQFYFVVQMTSYTSGSVFVQASATTGVAYTTLNGGGGGGTVSTVTGTNPIVVTSPSPGTVNVAVSPNPQFSGQPYGNASSCTLQSGTYGCVVIAQATNAPTAQPGNINIGGTAIMSANQQFAEMITAGGINVAGIGAFGGHLSTSSWLGVGSTTPASCEIVGFICSAGNLEANAQATPSPAPTGFYGMAVIAQATNAPTAQPGNINITGQAIVGSFYSLGAANYTTGTTCTANPNAPCRFTWSCTMASGACSTTQAVPTSAVCTLEPTVTPVASATDLISQWATLSSTTLTIHVADQLGTATSTFTGNGVCL